MIFVIILLSVIVAITIWNQYIKRQSILDVKIPQSENLFYNNQNAIATSATDIAAQLDENAGKPILLYIYTTWCTVCTKNFWVINEVAREFQNSDLKIISVAIDKDISANKLTDYLGAKGKYYFKPRYLEFRAGFFEELANRGIKYKNVIPFTALIGEDGQVKFSYNGSKKLDYLRYRIIKEIFTKE